MRIVALGCFPCALGLGSGCGSGSEPSSSPGGTTADDAPAVQSADLLAAAGLAVVKASQAGSVTQTIAE